LPIAARSENFLEATVSKIKKLQENETGIWLCKQRIYQKNPAFAENPKGWQKPSNSLNLNRWTR